MVIDNATDNVKNLLGESLSFVKAMYVVRTFIFYLATLYVQLNFVLYAIIFVTRTEEAAL